MKILVTGASGLLGHHIIEALKQHYIKSSILETSRQDPIFPCELTDKQQVNILINKVEPDIIINLAALTDVDMCELNPEMAFAINAEIAGNLAAAITEKSKLIQISTDQVYPDKSGLHKEGDENPVNIYGASKLKGEKLALLHKNTLVLRINMFGYSQTPNRQSLSDFFIKSFQQNKDIKLFKDVFFSPLIFQTLCNIIIKSIDSNLTGVFNLGSRSGASKAEFAMMIALYKKLNTQYVSIIESSVIKGRALRPKDLRMDVSKIEQALNITLPTLHEEVLKL